MKIRWKLYSLEKAGNAAAENEDAGFPILHNGANLRTNDFSCSLADGATQTSFSKQWAEILVRRTGSRPDVSKMLDQYVRDAQAEWESEIEKKQLTWPAEIKAREGAFCTFMWLHLLEEHPLVRNQRWEAVAIGDTCLFHFHQTALVDFYPIKNSSDFNNTPPLISTKPERNIHWLPTIGINGTWQSGDDFLLATDALAAWILRTHERGQEDVYQILRNRTGSRFDYVRWIHALRNNQVLKNDDTTLIWLSID